MGQLAHPTEVRINRCFQVHNAGADSTAELRARCFYILLPLAGNNTNPLTCYLLHSELRSLSAREAWGEALHGMLDGFSLTSSGAFSQKKKVA
jgi:hypothetical protein